ncbi:xanthine dehydrogenase molybdopterin binding subunit [Marinibactrum halimedae]|uniref:Xanthine dehydrogenase molybdopterin binding subunit n=1 Tax=Marinibactrum halimedae TaxID=1444977 RepID=A0AA37T2W4_9GAMM|nr:xanthine dehydrogenase molybdopterin binding subunit [Marinibactrum halimedae]MCD9459669.1 xanthine dehydrogenase molybdopterin binding subunit [Marinibactrum halimedae]GLS25695.1 xanthine dehydrogenase molybdopterin binding subunit [Marinibactrum halimedae]
MRNVRPYDSEQPAKLRRRPKKQPTKKPDCGAIGEAGAHESAIKHVTGTALYVDDMPEPPGTLHMAAGGSLHARAKIISMDLSAVKAASGVVDVFTHEDVPGELDVGPVYAGDPLFAVNQVEFVGQTLFTVVATSYELAQKAVALAVVEYDVEAPVVTVKDALQAQEFVLPTHTMQRGNAAASVAGAAHRLSGEGYMAGQEHFYLEGQISLVIPTEDGGMHVHTSSQHPTEVQKLVSEVLHLPLHQVTAEVRRMGGGFGGKESQAAAVSCAAAVAAHHLQCPVKFRLPRREDMERTGKRHDFAFNYDVGFDAQGCLEGIHIELAGLCGYSPDLSEGIVDRAMFHADNGYFLNQAKVTGHRCKTNTVSNTAFRGFGGPKGMVAIECVMDDIARHLGEDPLTIRKRNLYKPGKDTTHYGQTIEQHILPDLIEQLEQSSEYWERRQSIQAFNRQNRYVKKGLALTPVKFGISFTAKHLNQAGALVHIYTDGSILVNHGGTEMGQGLYTKVAQVVANEFGVDVSRVQVTSTRTDKIGNTSPTAASSGTDLNGLAAKNACETLRQGLLAFACEQYSVSESQVVFANGEVQVGPTTLPFGEFCRLAYMNRVPLMAHGFYKTPKIHYDRENANGRPFFYFANGAAAAEVVVDCFTGEYRVERVDILHDVGKSINPSLDIGQIEGGFIQGMGWLTTEELCWDDKGRVMSNSPANYKIPTAFDVPRDFRVAIYEGANNEDTVFNSKAVGEPPLMLAIAVWAALRDACASVADYKMSPRLDPPATPERVFMAMQAAQQFVASTKLASENQESEAIYEK